MVEQRLHCGLPTPLVPPTSALRWADSLSDKTLRPRRVSVSPLARIPPACFPPIQRSSPSFPNTELQKQSTTINRRARQWFYCIRLHSNRTPIADANIPNTQGTQTTQGTQVPQVLPGPPPIISNAAC